MSARRLPDGEHPVLPGDYSRVDGEWWAKPPTDDGVPQQPGRRMNLHAIIEHEDGTITDAGASGGEGSEGSPDG